MAKMYRLSIIRLGGSYEEPTPKVFERKPKTHRPSKHTKAKQPKRRKP